MTLLLVKTARPTSTTWSTASSASSARSPRAVQLPRIGAIIGGGSSRPFGTARPGRTTRARLRSAVVRAHGFRVRLRGTLLAESRHVPARSAYTYAYARSASLVGGSSVDPDHRVRGRPTLQSPSRVRYFQSCCAGSGCTGPRGSDRLPKAAQLRGRHEAGVGAAARHGMITTRGHGRRARSRPPNHLRLSRF